MSEQLSLNNRACLAALEDWEEHGFALLDVELSPYQELAAAVLHQAVVDATCGRLAARSFLRGGEDLAFWCAVAGIPPALVQQKFHQRNKSCACAACAVSPIDSGRAEVEDAQRERDCRE